VHEDLGERVAALEAHRNSDTEKLGRIEEQVKELFKRVDGHTKIIYLGLGGLYLLHFLTANQLLNISRLVAK
jgi:hypothetical protein